MTLADTRSSLAKLLLAVAFALLLVAGPRLAVAQDATGDAAAQANEELADAEAATDDQVVADSAPGYEYMGPEMIKGQPVDGGWTFQDQHNADGRFALWMHDAILMPLIVAISLFVLGLLIWVMVRYRRSANPVASKTSHNTLIEVIWTLVPVLILVAIAIPSISLLARQYESPPEDAVTVKVTGYQWYWGYEFPDNGGFEVISNMMEESDALAAGEPPQLAVDNRLVLPVGVPIRIQTTGADVIHSFSIPSLWFKIDAVPGRLNERMLTIDEPGIYYGMCSELCGARHGYMPIAIEAVPLERWQQWVLSQPGGSLGEPEEEAVADTSAAEADAELAAEGGDAEGMDAAQREGETAVETAATN